MDASNPSSITQSTSQILPTVQPSPSQTGAIASTSIQAPQVSSMMQQINLQQLNFQQALLMQQFALAQQAVSKPIKSPAEVAAARAAEISKQLEGSDATEKKPPERSKSSNDRSLSKSESGSGSGSRSPLKSKSRSRSLSPIKRRRARSRSLSPIRYRRDHYSSYRTRENYGYRGHNYRNYYRGSYNDYSRYRYGRDYDHHYRRRSRSRGRRRSRTRSRSPRRDRSRGRRRSQTVSPPPKRRSRTRSPKDSRKKSISPHVKRDGLRSRHTPRLSISREAMRSPSVSSGRINVSPVKSRIRSPSQPKSSDRYPPPELSYESDEDRTAVNYRGQKKSIVLSRRELHSSSSRSRSLSVSLDNEKYTNKVSLNRRSVDEHHEAMERSSVEHDEEAGSPGEIYASESEGGKKRQSEGRRFRKLTRSPNANAHEHSESVEDLDDWRDDLKNVVKGKGISFYRDGEVNGREERENNDKVGTQMVERDSSMHNKQECAEHSASSAGRGDSTKADGEQDVLSDEVHGQQDVLFDEGHVPVVRRDELVSPPEERRQFPGFEDAKEVSNDDDEGEDVIFVEDVVFEGPERANVTCEERMQSSEAGGSSFNAQSLRADSPNGRKVLGPILDKKMTGGVGSAEYDEKDFDGQLCSYDEEPRDRSRSRDGKKHQNELSKHERRKDGHKKHRKRHRHVNADDDSVKSEGARRRHKRKHKREGEHGHKERKKRRHKHRSRSSSASEEDSSSNDEIEVRSSSRKKKRGSKKHKATKRDVSESSPSSA